ncbi:MAG TPA: serine/threonine-protein kinase [Polyangiaceae bacterium]
MASDDPDERARERVGTVLNDKWTLERLIGIGGMAAVYAGLHRNGARAAIKVLHPAYARRKEIRERFLREGYAANRVNHSGVVKVLDDDVMESGPDEGGAFLVMELLEGQSIEDRLDRGPPIGEGELLSIVRAVLDVLDSAHKAGVVHRDLKPENLFLARDPDKPTAPPKIKILDFGLARIMEGGGGRTMAGIAIGTPSYMPPEQAAGRVHDIDARSDLFALGASAFRILANRTVHPADGAIAICARMAKEPAPPLRSIAPNVSEKTAAVIDRALEFAREDRWQSAAEMRAAVDDAIASLGGDVIEIESGMIEVSAEPPAARRERAPSAEPAAERSPRPERVSRDSPPPPAPRKTSSSFLLWILIFVALGVLAKLGWDRYGPSASIAGETPDAAPAVTSVPETAAVPEAAAPPVVVFDAHVEPEVVEDASVDAPAVLEAPDASADAAIADAALDAEALDAAEPAVVVHDAGAHVHHRDGGPHHHIHTTHHTHHH